LQRRPGIHAYFYNDFQIVYGNLVEGKNLSIENRLVPSCVFTDPQLGGVGMTEKEARAKGFELKIGRCPMTTSRAPSNAAKPPAS